MLIPVNHNNAHWTGAAINFRRRRIESYDSMGMRRDNVFKVGLNFIHIGTTLILITASTFVHGG